MTCHISILYTHTHTYSAWPGIPARRCKEKQVKKNGSTKAAYYYRADITLPYKPRFPTLFLLLRLYIRNCVCCGHD